MSPRQKRTEVDDKEAKLWEQLKKFEVVKKWKKQRNDPKSIDRAKPIDRTKNQGAKNISPKEKRQPLREIQNEDDNVSPEASHDWIDSGTGSMPFFQTIPSPIKTISTRSKNGLNETNFVKKKRMEKELENIRAEREKWLTTQKTDGTWIKCCHKNCGKWRLVFEYKDSAEVPETWYCTMNRDPDFASCDIPEEEVPKSVREEMIETKYSIGSIVWARLDGFPWWPCMVDEDPDTFKFCRLRGSSEVPIKYHVVFFDTKLEFAWIHDRDLKVYKNNQRETVVKRTKFRNTDFSPDLDRACLMAEAALPLSISQRLQKFGCTARMAREYARKKKSKYIRTPNSVDNFVLKDNGLTREKEIEREMKEKSFDVGDVVWARPRRFPWWPAIVDTCPILEKHIQVQKSHTEPIMYHVVYFNEKRLEYDWLSENNLRIFSKNPKSKMLKSTKVGAVDYKRPLEVSCNLAMEADALPLDERLQRFGIIEKSNRQSMLSRGLPDLILTSSPPWYQDENPILSRQLSSSEKSRKKSDHSETDISDFDFPNRSTSSGSDSHIRKSIGRKLGKSREFPSTSNGDGNGSSFFFSRPGCSRIYDKTIQTNVRDDIGASPNSNKSNYFLRSRSNSSFSSLSDGPSKTIEESLAQFLTSAASQSSEDSTSENS